MKKIMKIFCLVYTMLGVHAHSSENFKIGEWQKFIGISIGAGLYDIQPGYIFSFNTRLAGYSPTRAFGGNIAITAGGQKYTYEKVGWRYVFVLRADYMDSWKYRYNQNFHLKSGWGINATMAIDGMFDFIRANNSSFGMILGVGFELFDLKIIKSESESVWGVTTPFVMDMRIGFRGQFNKNVIDLVLTFPYGGGIGISGGVGARTFLGTTLTLGYKHLF